MGYDWGMERRTELRKKGNVVGKYGPGGSSWSSCGSGQSSRISEGDNKALLDAALVLLDGGPSSLPCPVEETPHSHEVLERPKQLLGQRQLLTTGTTIYTRY